MRQFLIGHGDSVTNTPRSQEFAFFDQYAYEVSLHQSDLFWVGSKGHRTPELGDLPLSIQGIPSTEGEDPFGDDLEDDQSEDPFGED